MTNKKNQRIKHTTRSKLPNNTSHISLTHSHPTCMRIETQHVLIYHTNLVVAVMRSSHLSQHVKNEHCFANNVFLLICFQNLEHTTNRIFFSVRDALVVTGGFPQLFLLRGLASVSLHVLIIKERGVPSFCFTPCVDGMIWHARTYKQNTRVSFKYSYTYNDQMKRITMHFRMS